MQNIVQLNELAKKNQTPEDLQRQNDDKLYGQINMASVQNRQNPSDYVKTLPQDQQDAFWRAERSGRHNLIQQSQINQSVPYKSWLQSQGDRQFTADMVSTPTGESVSRPYATYLKETQQPTQPVSQNNNYSSSYRPPSQSYTGYNPMSGKRTNISPWQGQKENLWSNYLSKRNRITPIGS